VEHGGTGTEARTDGRLLAVGDIHGCVDELAVLLRAVAPSAGDTLVFLGDYVDRGPSSCGVIDLLIELRDSARCETVFLRGNHEDMFLAYLGEEGSHGEAFLFNGGRATLASYGLTPPLRGAQALRRVPESHLAFLRGSQLWYLHEPFLFVHAGISPLRPLEAQEKEDLLWIREEFVRNRHRLPQTVVFGHTPQREVLWHLPFKIGLDTGCVYGNKLSCLDLTSRSLLQVERGSTAVTRRDVPEALPRVPGARELTNP
jgi:serine/threonine protein phosphatase 1